MKHPWQNKFNTQKYDCIYKNKKHSCIRGNYKQMKHPWQGKFDTQEND